MKDLIFGIAAGIIGFVFALYTLQSLADDCNKTGGIFLMQQHHFVCGGD